VSVRGDRTAQFLPHLPQERRHIRWQWGREREPFSTLRVLKADLLSVQGLAWEGPQSLLQSRVAWQTQWPGTIHGIAEHGVADVRQVHPNLVRATGFKGETHEAQGAPGFEHLVMRAGGTTVALDHGHFLPLLGMAPNGRIDSALQRWQAPTHERRITPPQLAGLELRGEMAMTAVVLGDQQETGGVFVEPVHDTWAFFTPDARQRPAVK
jgi:hypothetical protein